MQRTWNCCTSWAHCKRGPSAEWCSWIHLAAVAFEGWNFGFSNRKGSWWWTVDFSCDTSNFQLGFASCCMVEQSIRCQAGNHSIWKERWPHVHWKALHVWWNSSWIHQDRSKSGATLGQRNLVGQNTYKRHPYHCPWIWSVCDPQCASTSYALCAGGAWSDGVRPMGVWLCSIGSSDGLQQASFTSNASWNAIDWCGSCSGEEVCAGEPQWRSGTRAASSGGADASGSNRSTIYDARSSSCRRSKEAWTRKFGATRGCKETAHRWGTACYPTWWYHGQRWWKSPKNAEAYRLTQTTAHEPGDFNWPGSLWARG